MCYVLCNRFKLVCRDIGYYVFGNKNLLYSRYIEIETDIISDKVKEKLMIHKGPVRCLCVSKDSSLLISGSSDQTICITNILSNPEVDRYLKLTESDSGKIITHIIRLIVQIFHKIIVM